MDSTSSPFPEQAPDPLGHAMFEGGQKVAELTSVAALIGQVRAQRQAMSVSAETAEADLAAARAKWAPARDDVWRANAYLPSLVEAWGAALPYKDTDAGAAEAVDLTENQMRNLEPYAMDRYDERRAILARKNPRQPDWETRAEAMQATVRDFTRRRAANGQPGTEPARGLTDADAEILRGLLGPLTRAAEKNEGLLDPAAIARWLKGHLPPGMAARIKQGLAAAQPADPVPAAVPAASARTVSRLDPVASLSWPPGTDVSDALMASALRRGTGGHRATVRRGSMPEQRRSSRPHQ